MSGGSPSDVTTAARCRLHWAAENSSQPILASLALLSLAADFDHTILQAMADWKGSKRMEGVF